MAKQIRQVGRALLYVLPLVVLALIFVLPQRPSEAAYGNPFWDNVSSSPECACANCPCEGAPEWFPEGGGLSVNVRTREVVWDHHLFRMPGLVGDNAFSIRWRSTIDGESQMGNGILPSWELTAEKVILNAQYPDDPGGHEVWIRRPTGRIDVFDWDGSSYSAASCNVVLVTEMFAPIGCEMG